MGSRKSKPIVVQSDPAVMGAITKLMEKLSEQNAALANTEKMRQEIREQQQQFEKRQKEYQDQVEKLRAENESIQKELEANEIHSLDDVERINKGIYDKMVRQAAILPKAPLPTQNNVGFFGLTGTGKSSLLNTLAGQDNMCEVGDGECTTVAQPYSVSIGAAGTSVTLWDMPGKTDLITYFSVSYIGLIKAMSFVGVMIDRSTHQMSSLIRLLEHIQVPYFIILNKFDLRANKDALKEQIKREIREECSSCKGVFFVSAMNPAAFDFVNLVQAILTSVANGASASNRPEGFPAAAAATASATNA